MTKMKKHTITYKSNTLIQIMQKSMISVLNNIQNRTYSKLVKKVQNTNNGTVTTVEETISPAELRMQIQTIQRPQPLIIERNEEVLNPTTIHNAQSQPNINEIGMYNHGQNNANANILNEMFNLNRPIQRTNANQLANVLNEIQQINNETNTTAQTNNLAALDIFKTTAKKNIIVENAKTPQQRPAVVLEAMEKFKEAVNQNETTTLPQKKEELERAIATQTEIQSRMQSQEIRNEIKIQQQQQIQEAIQQEEQQTVLNEAHSTRTNELIESSTALVETTRILNQQTIFGAVRNVLIENVQIIVSVGVLGALAATAYSVLKTSQSTGTSATQSVNTNTGATGNVSNQGDIQVWPTIKKFIKTAFEKMTKSLNKQ